MNLTIPENTTADVYLPFFSRSQKVTLNGDKVKFRHKEKFAVIEDLGSGSAILEVIPKRH